MDSLCFVLIPVGVRPDPSGESIDYDALYEKVLRPAISSAGMEAVRAEEGYDGDALPTSMFERFMLCDFAIVDVATASPGVSFDLGVRHAVRPGSTIGIAVRSSGTLLDLHQIEVVPFSVAGTSPNAAEVDADAIAAALDVARMSRSPKPVYRLVDELEPQDISRLRTDSFRDEAGEVSLITRRLADAREESADAVATIERDLGSLAGADFSVVVDLLLSYRAVRAWDRMLSLIDRIPRPLARSVLVREQQAFALNRSGRTEEAERALLDLIEDRGGSSETYGLLGRVYKDRREVCADEVEARACLEQAIDAYLNGFERDWRDAYPGVNAVTLMELAEPPDPRRHDLIPVVRYSSLRRIEGSQPDYWDHATLLELAVLASDRGAADRHATDALDAVREVWEPETTARNLSLIREARVGRGDDVAWLDHVIDRLLQCIESFANLPRG